MTRREKLQHKLSNAVQREDYEAAAKLRDQLAKLPESKEN